VGSEAPQSRKRVGGGARDPGGVGQTGGEQPRDSAPVLPLIDGDGPGCRHRRVVETSPSDEFLDEPALPPAGFTLDDDPMPPPALRPPPRRTQPRSPPSQSSN